MQTFTDQKASFDAIELPEMRHGELVVFCEIRINGNYLKGPVPVNIGYKYIFNYEPAWHDIDGNEINSQTKLFDTPNERNMFLSSHFSISGNWEEYVNRFA